MPSSLFDAGFPLSGAILHLGMSQFSVFNLVPVEIGVVPLIS